MNETINRVRAAPGVGVAASLVGIAAILTAACFWMATRTTRGRLGDLNVLAVRQAAELAGLRAQRQRQTMERSQAEQALALHQPGTLGPDALAMGAKPVVVGARWQTLAEIQRENLVSFRLPFADPRNGELLPLVRELLDLTPAEATALDAAWHAARQKINALMEAEATARIEPDGRLVLHVGKFAGGAEILDELSGAIELAVGRDRKVSFETLFMEQIAGELAQFGAEERWLTLTREATPSGGEPGFNLRDQRTSFVDSSNRQVMATPRSGALRPVGMRTSEERVTLVEFAARYPSLARMLPPDFLKTK